MNRVGAEILSIGSELLLHGRLDSNAGELGQRLAGHGFRVDRRATVGDELQTLTAAFREAAGRAALVLSTGGLGPTSDDITRQAVAAAFGRELRLDAAILLKIEARFRALGRAMPRSQLETAYTARLSQWKLDSGGDDTVAADDHRHVMEGRTGVKYRL